MKIVKTIFIFLIMIVVVLLFLEMIPVAPKYELENAWIIKEGERPLIVPHGGAKLLYPENTILAYDELALAGYDVFEIDLCITSDDVLISMHDVDFNNKKIREYSYNQLTQYNHAKNFVNLNNVKPYEAILDENALEQKLVPAKLEELFKTYGDKRYILELKDTIENSGEQTFTVAVNELLALIDQYNMNDKVIVSSFDDKVVQLIREKSNNQIMTSTATNESNTFVVMSTLFIDFFYKPKDAALMLPYHDDLSPSQVEKIPNFLRDSLTVYDSATSTYYTNIAKKSIVDDAHRHNMAIFYWTVNTKEDMKKLIELGVDGIITDRPDLLKELLDEMYP